MTNADLIDLALCGGYVWEPCDCDCPRCTAGDWVKAKMPTMWVHENPKKYTSVMQLLASQMLERLDQSFIPHTKTGMTINVAKPRRWQQ